MPAREVWGVRLDFPRGRGLVSRGTRSLGEFPRGRISRGTGFPRAGDEVQGTSFPGLTGQGMRFRGRVSQDLQGRG
jgi:hypothetical protein